jgi:hypothetical protein
LTEALVALGACTAGSISCAEGSSAITAWVEGAAATSLCGSSSSLQEETCYIQPERKRASTVQSQNSQNTYDHSLKNRTGDRTGEAFGSQFTGWTAGSNRFDVGFLVVK